MASIVREATTADHGQLAESLADAFFDEPTSVWAIPRGDIRRRLLVRFFCEYLRQYQRHGTIWCDDELCGAALWAPPGQAKTTFSDAARLARAAFDLRLALRLPLVAWGGAAIERRQPEGEFFYLAVLGVAPAAQGGGLGSRLLAPALELCDSDRLGAYLESSKEENVDFYSRHGFRVTDRLRLPRGPLVPLMYREPS